MRGLGFWSAGYSLVGLSGTAMAMYCGLMSRLMVAMRRWMVASSGWWVSVSFVHFMMSMEVSRGWFIG